MMKEVVEREGGQWGGHCEKTLREILPWGGALKVRQFVEGWLGKEKDTKEEEPMLAPTTVEAPAEPVLTRQGQSPSIIYQPTQSTFYSKTQPSRPASAFTPTPAPSQPITTYGRSEPKEWDGIEQSVNSTLSSIQQRREKLRQDSLERKKLIENVLSSKRQACGVDWNAPIHASPITSPAAPVQVRPSTPKSYLKHSASGQLSRPIW